MTRTANKRARGYVERKENFIGSNLYSTSDPRGLYIVFSYGAHYPALVYDRETDRWFVNDDRFSRSSDRHTSQAKPFDTEMTWVDTGFMLDLVRAGSLTGAVWNRLGGRAA